MKTFREEPQDELFAATDKLWATSLMGSYQSTLPASSVSTYVDGYKYGKLHGNRSLHLDCRYRIQIIYNNLATSN